MATELAGMDVGQLRVAPRMPCHAEEVHGKKDRVRADEGEPEMRITESDVHLAPEHPRKPEVRPGEDGDHGCYAHDEMEVRDHEISVVQIHIECRLRQDRPGQSPGHKYGDEA